MSERPICLSVDEAEKIRQALDVSMVEDFRLNGCACSPTGLCYHHAHYVRPALALIAGRLTDKQLAEVSA